MSRAAGLIAARSSLAAALIVFGSAVLVVSSASAQTEAWQKRGLSSTPGIGASVRFVGDVNGDGVKDFVAGGVSSFDLGGPLGIGRAMLCSGSDGAVLQDVAGVLAAEFGAAVADAGDVDQDGASDFAVGAPAEADGAVHVYSGATGSLLRSDLGTSSASRFGSSLANLGDLDGDGIAELAIGAPAHETGGVRLGLAEIHSGASGAVLAQWTGASANGEFGSVLDDAGDVDADGVHDLLVVEQTDTSAGSNVGSLRIFSGRTLTLLSQWTLNGTAGGWTASTAGDVDADGADDVVIGNDRWPTGWVYRYYQLFDYVGGVWIVSGRTGTQIWAFTGFPFIGNGYDVSAAGDVDADGFDDIAFDYVDPWYIEVVAVMSGRTGTMLADLERTSEVSYGRALDGGADLDGNGVADLLVGSSFDLTFGFGNGVVRVDDPSTRTTLLVVPGKNRIDTLGAATALLDDVDGDGTRDLLVGSASILARGSARILSGVDGSELRRHDGPDAAPFVRTFEPYGAAVAALPDLDGDGIGEYAITNPAPFKATPLVIEIRSGATGAVAQTLTSPNTDAGFGVAIAAAIQPSGRVELCVGQPLDSYSGNRGRVVVFDVASGSVVVQYDNIRAGDYFGSSVAFVGDLDHDGVGDWAVGGPRPYPSDWTNARAAVVSGKTGHILTQWFDKNYAGFGASVAGPGDIDNDGTIDVLVGAPREGPNERGALYLYSGKTRTLLRSWLGPNDVERFGQPLALAGDVNRDGVGDFIVGASADGAHTGRAWLYSGRTGGLLERFDGLLVGDAFGATFSAPAPGEDAFVNGDAIPDLTIGAPLDVTDGFGSGRLALLYLDDLFLQIDPTSLASGQTVTLDTRGGPTSALAALFLTAVDSVPLFQLVNVGTFDAEGIWEITGTTPAGLSGHTAELRAYAIGFVGKLVDSTRVTVTFL
jgi:hypothetical protein